MLGPGAPRTRTGADGRFRVDGLVPGQPYEVRSATIPGLVSPYFNTFQVKSGEVKDLGTGKAEREK